MTVPNSLLSMNGNMLVAIDIETTGLQAGYHEIVQISVVPLDSDLQPCKRAFYVNIRPEHPDRADSRAAKVHGLDMDWLLTNGLDKWKAADMLEEWVSGLDLPFSKRLAPLSHNFPFEKGFLMAWLGKETYDALFFIHYRDTMALGAMCNDLASFWGKNIPFGELSLSKMCSKFGIVNERSHDALQDALCGAQLYRCLIESLGG